jgi:ribonuclease HI
MAKKRKYYVVWVGAKPGIYDSWDKCLKQTKGYPAAKYKSYESMAEAERAYTGGAPTYSYSPKTEKSTFVSKANWEAQGVILNSYAVDAACSGNPGLLEYRGVRTHDASEIFKMGPFQEGTNNIGEFLGIVHALAVFNAKDMHNIVLYSDSKTAIAWVRNKKIKSTLERNSRNAELWQLVDRALIWLNNNTWDHKILKWETKEWGEIPADFGRK